MLLALTASFRRNLSSERSFTRKTKIGGRYDRRRLRRATGKMNSMTVEQLLFKPGRVLGENAGLAGFKEVLRLDYYKSTQIHN